MEEIQKFNEITNPRYSFLVLIRKVWTSTKQNPEFHTNPYRKATTIINKQGPNSKLGLSNSKSLI